MRKSLFHFTRTSILIGRIQSRKQWPPWEQKKVSGRYGKVGLSFKEVQHRVIELTSRLLHPIMLIQSQIIYREVRYTKNLNNVLNQNHNATKRKSIVDNLCLL